MTNSSTSDPRAELSAMSAALDDLTRRLAGLAERLSAEGNEAAQELFEVERALDAGKRRLTSVVTNSRR